MKWRFLKDFNVSGKLLTLNSFFVVYGGIAETMEEALKKKVSKDIFQDSPVFLHYRRNAVFKTEYQHVTQILISGD